MSKKASRGFRIMFHVGADDYRVYPLTVGAHGTARQPCDGVCAHPGRAPESGDDVSGLQRG